MFKNRFYFTNQALLLLFFCFFGVSDTILPPKKNHIACAFHGGKMQIAKRQRGAKTKDQSQRHGCASAACGGLLGNSLAKPKVS